MRRQWKCRISGDSEKEPNWLADPGELNRYLSQNHVYDSQGNLQWEQLNRLESFQAEVRDEVSAEVIEEYLRMGNYPIVRVRMNGYGSFHYVLIISSRDGMFYCMDPLSTDEKTVPLSKYNNRVYAIRCVYPGYQRLVLETEEAEFYDYFKMIL